MQKNDGGYKVRNGRIHVFGRIDGEEFRKSTGKEATPANIKYIKNNYREVLLKLYYEKREVKQAFKKVSLESFGKEVLELSAHKRESATQKDHLAKLNKHILPYFEKFSMKDIKPIDIIKWQNIIRDLHSDTMVKKATWVFNEILHHAVGNEIIPRNPIDFTDKVKVVHVKKPPYALDDMLLMMTKSTGFMKVWLNLAFTTGMRVGELLGLKWNDVDFDKSIIHIQRSMVKSEIKKSSKQKNHNRFVVMTPAVKVMLLEHKHDNEWIFPSPRSKTAFTEPKSIVKYHFKPLLKTLGVKFISLNATRHTFISILRNEGVSLDFIQQLVGHAANSDVTDKHYATFEMNDTKMQAVNNVFNGLLEKKG